LGPAGKPTKEQYRVALNWLKQAKARATAMLIELKQPFLIFDRQIFREATLVAISRGTITREVGLLSIRLAAKIRSVTQSTLAASASLDDWSDSRRRGYTCVQVNVIHRDDKGEVVHGKYTITNEGHGDKDPNRETLSEIIQRHMSQYPWWDDGRCTYIVSDTTSLNPAIAARLEKGWMPCFCHVINLMMGNIVAEFRQLITPILLGAQVLRYSKEFRKICRAAAKQYWSLPTWIEVRWWSLWKLLRRSLDLRHEIDEALQTIKPKKVLERLERRNEAWAQGPSDPLEPTVDPDDKVEVIAEKGAPIREAVGGKDNTQGLGKAPLATEANPAQEPALPDLRDVQQLEQVLGTTGKTLFDEDLDDIRAKMAEPLAKKKPFISEQNWEAAKVLESFLFAGMNAQKALEGDDFGKISDVHEVISKLRVQANRMLKQRTTADGERNVYIENEQLRAIFERGWTAAEKRWKAIVAKNATPRVTSVVLTIRDVVEIACVLKPSNLVAAPRLLGSGRWDEVRGKIRALCLDHLKAKQTVKQPQDAPKGDIHATERDRERQALLRDMDLMNDDEDVPPGEEIPAPVVQIDDEPAQYFSRAQELARMNLTDKELLKW
jgi:hypothetical protein